MFYVSSVPRITLGQLTVLAASFLTQNNFKRREVGEEKIWIGLECWRDHSVIIRLTQHKWAFTGNTDEFLATENRIQKRGLSCALECGQFLLKEKDGFLQNSRRKYTVIEESEFGELKNIMNNYHILIEAKRAN